MVVASTATRRRLAFGEVFKHVTSGVIFQLTGPCQVVDSGLQLVRIVGFFVNAQVRAADISATFRSTRATSGVLQGGFVE